MLWPLLVFAVAVVALVAVLLLVSHVAGERHSERATGDPYESGIASTGTARLRFPAKFYLVALLFVIFDLEAAFLFAWAVAATELGWSGYVGLLVFVLLLVAGLIYEWRQGALDWGLTLHARHRAAAARASSRQPPLTLRTPPFQTPEESP